MTTRFRHAHLEERAELEALQLRASLIWEEYRAALLAHPEAIAIPAEQLHERRVRVAEREGRIVGFSVVLPIGPETGELDGLFVDPDAMRSGLGAALIDDAATAAGASILEVTANPRAEAFYRRVGFVRTGEAQTEFGPALRMRRGMRREGAPT